jgi:pimeloyl-ACP methyl ester carboxylesterase
VLPALLAALGVVAGDPDSAFWGWNRVWLSAAFRDGNISTELQTPRAPLLAVQGLDDVYGTLAQIRGLREPVPHTQCLELPACGHSPHRDQPAALIAAVTAFIHQHTGDTP